MFVESSFNIPRKAQVADVVSCLRRLKLGGSITVACKSHVVSRTIYFSFSMPLRPSRLQSIEHWEFKNDLILYGIFYPMMLPILRHKGDNLLDWTPKMVDDMAPYKT
jgi:hypothetical protein